MRHYKLKVLNSFGPVAFCRVKISFNFKEAVFQEKLPQFIFAESNFVTRITGFVDVLGNNVRIFVLWILKKR